MNAKPLTLLLTVASLLIGSNYVNAQFGIQTSFYNSNELFSITSEENRTKSKNCKQFGFVSVRKIQKKKIEIVSELNYSIENNFIVKNDTFQFRFANVRLNGNFYIFNFNTDWNKLTVAKEKNFIERGLFLNASIGMLNWFRRENSAMLNKFSFQTRFPLGFGIGLDLELSNSLTLTPFYKTNIRRMIIKGYSNKIFINKHFGVRLFYNIPKL